MNSRALGGGLNRFTGDANRERSAASSCYTTVSQRNSTNSIPANRPIDYKRVIWEELFLNTFEERTRGLYEDFNRFYHPKKGSRNSHDA